MVFQNRPRSRRPGAVLVIVALLAALLPVASAQAYAQATPGAGEQVRVIVELTDPPALAVARSGLDAVQRAAGLRRHARLLEQRQQQWAAHAGARVVHHLTAAFNGLVVEVPSAELAHLQSVPGVRAVHAEATYRAALDSSVPLVGAPEVWRTTDPGGDAVTGTGVTVAVLDTGVDYRHPDLGGGIGPQHKVVGGHDFVNDDQDPLDDHGHGTHVAGIVAADGQVTGVAPGASLTAYKVLDQFGNGQLSNLLAGLDWAVHPDNPHRADVVNLSLSGPGDGTDPLSVAAGNAAAAGTVVVAAAGNHGPGAGTVTAPAAAPGVIAVGATASGVWLPRVRLVEPGDEEIPTGRSAFSADLPADGYAVEVVDVGEGMPGSYDDVEVAGKAVLVAHNSAEDDDFAHQKARYAEQRGAAVAMFYLPDEPRAVQADPDAAAATLTDDIAPGVDDGRLTHLVAMKIAGASAAHLRHLLSQGPVRIQITAEDATDLLADFSSRGPSPALAAKPELVAPGAEVLSTMPEGGYARASGTSMAAPHVAGAAALLRQLRPAWQPPQLGAALVNTARPVAGAVPSWHGAGRLDVAAAAGAAVVATPPALSLGLAGMAEDTVTATTSVTLENLGSEPVELALSAHQHADPQATVTLEQEHVHLAAGGSADVTLQITLLTPEVATDVTGWVVAEGAGAVHLTVPFLLAARPLQVTVSPDPAPAGGPTTAWVSSDVPLQEAPSVTLDCPHASPEPIDVEVSGDMWRAEIIVDHADVCRVRAVGVADRADRPSLNGAASFLVADPPRDPRGPLRWHQMGPNAEAGWFAFGQDRSRVAVVSRRWPAVFVSDDRMQTWRELRTMPVGDGAPAAVAVHPHDDDIMYVAVNAGPAIDPSYDGQVLLTTDGGVSWRILPGWDAGIYRMALDDAGQALAVLGDGVVRVTADRGDTWHDLGPWSGINDAHWIGPDLYLATTDGLVRVPDANGPTPGEPERLFQPGVLGWASAVGGDAGTILVGAWPGATLYASDDGGASFREVHDPGGLSYERVHLYGDEAVALQGSGDVWYSPDRGGRWEVLPAPVDSVGIDVGRWRNPHPSVADDTYVSSVAAGIYRLADGAPAQRVGIPAAEVFSLAVAGEGARDILVAATHRETARTEVPHREVVRPADLEWQTSGDGQELVSTPFVAASPADRSVVYKVRRGGQTFGIYRSEDAGASWELVAEPTGMSTALLVHPADPQRVYVGYSSFAGAGLMASDDGGDSWRKIHHGREFTALAGDPADADRIWAGDRDGLYRSDDGGFTVTKVASVQVTAIEVDPGDPERLVVGGRSIYVSHDGGVTLEPALDAELEMWVSDLLFAGAGSGRVFAATSSFFDELGRVKSGRGVLVSDDGGASWRALPTPDNPNVTSLALSTDGRHLFAGTMGGSVHRIRLLGPLAAPGRR